MPPAPGGRRATPSTRAGRRGDRIRAETAYADTGLDGRGESVADGPPAGTRRSPGPGGAGRPAAQRVDGGRRPGPYRLLGPPAAVPDAAVGGGHRLPRW